VENCVGILDVFFVKTKAETTKEATTVIG